MRRARAPVIVVGSGVAGVVTALACAPLPVRLLCRAGSEDDSASLLAQGGIAAAIDADDRVDAHVDDTLCAGAGHNDVDMVRWLCEQAPNAIAWLQQLGVPFDRDPDGRLALGREGGHRTARIVHAGGDASGAALMRSLGGHARRASHIQRVAGVDVDTLLLRGGRVCGVGLCDARGRRHEMEASAVVLATGGIGGLYARTSNPSASDGSGLALALAAGAAMRDLEFVQFHPTGLDIGAAHRLPLVTEALRGAGASLHRAGGEALMRDRHPLGDLAPRDVVARHVWYACRKDGHAWLDASAVEGDWEQRFPTVLGACLAHGLDPRRQRMPVTPVAHFHMGGMAVDADGRSSVPGLYAVGEVACNGVHGANRLASNSLLEAVVCGRRLGEALVAGSESGGKGRLRRIERGPSLTPARLHALRTLMSTAAGPVRSLPTLQRAQRTVGDWTREGWQARLAQRLLAAAITRGNSLGSHWREDVH